MFLCKDEKDIHPIKTLFCFCFLHEIAPSFHIFKTSPALDTDDRFSFLSWIEVVYEWTYKDVCLSHNDKLRSFFVWIHSCESNRIIKSTVDQQDELQCVFMPCACWSMKTLKACWTACRTLWSVYWAGGDAGRPRMSASDLFSPQLLVVTAYCFNQTIFVSRYNYLHLVILTMLTVSTLQTL